MSTSGSIDKALGAIRLKSTELTFNGSIPMGITHRGTNKRER
jgi:hypothetical protein